jgi:excinuclease UvrABC helicase subunit UvrB
MGKSLIERKSLIDIINRIISTNEQIENIIKSTGLNTQDSKIRVKQLNSRLDKLRKEVSERVSGNVHILDLEVNRNRTRGLLTNMTKAEVNYLYNNFSQIFPGESVTVIKASTSPTFIK